MSRVALVAVALGGLVLGLWPVVMSWDARRPPPLVIDADMSIVGRLASVVRRASALMAAGTVAGVLVLGLGLRLMMRVAAATSPASAQGRLTDADEVVGEVTLGGSIFLVMGVGLIAAMVIAAAWVALRRWLPDRSALAGAMVAAIGAGALARPSGLVDPDNPDFVILSPAWLALALVIAILCAFGISFAVLADRWAATWPAVEWTPRGVAAALPFVGFFAVSVLLIIPAIVIAVEVGWVAGGRPGRRATHRLLERSERAGRWLLGVGAATGTVWVVVSATQVLVL